MTTKTRTISDDDREKAIHILDTLVHFTEPELPDGTDDILSVLIRSILSQATSTKNRNQAFANLLDRFEGDWNGVRIAGQWEVEEAIKVGGLAEQKSARIQKILEMIFLEQGSCSLEHLRKESAAESFKYLCSFPGVGPQSAALTIMLGAGADICPVNTDVLRVLKRVEFLTSENGVKAHKRVNALFPEERLKESHYALINHGRSFCVSRTPQREGCPLSDICTFEGCL